MNLDSLTQKSSEWLRGTGPESDVVVSTRIRLARNLAEFPFSTRIDKEARQAVFDKARDCFDDLAIPNRLSFIEVSSLEELDRQFLVERQLISRELSEGEGPRGVAISRDEDIAIMVNEEDHLRVQALRSGLTLDECWQSIDEIDELRRPRPGPEHRVRCQRPGGQHLRPGSSVAAGEVQNDAERCRDHWSPDAGRARRTAPSRAPRRTRTDDGSRFFFSWSDEPAVSEDDGRTTDARTVLTYARSYEGARTAYSSTVREPLTTATARADAPSGRGTTTSQCDFAGTPRMMHSGGVLPVVTFLIRRSNAPSSDAEMTLTRFASASTSWLPPTSTRQLHVGASPPMPSAGDIKHEREVNCGARTLLIVITRASRRA